MEIELHWLKMETTPVNTREKKSITKCFRDYKNGKESKITQTLRRKKD